MIGDMITADAAKSISDNKNLTGVFKTIQLKARQGEYSAICTRVSDLDRSIKTLEDLGFNVEIVVKQAKHGIITVSW